MATSSGDGRTEEFSQKGELMHGRLMKAAFLEYKNNRLVISPKVASKSKFLNSTLCYTSGYAILFHGRTVFQVSYIFVELARMQQPNAHLT